MSRLCPVELSARRLSAGRRSLGAKPAFREIAIHDRTLVHGRRILTVLFGSFMRYAARRSALRIFKSRSGLTINAPVAGSNAKRDLL